VSYRSTALIVIIVFVILFSLLYSASFIAIQNAEGFYQIIASKRADLEVYRLRTPQNICFELDNKILDEVDQMMAWEQGGTGDTLSRAINSSDGDAESDQQLEQQMERQGNLPKEYFEQMGNRYSGEGLRLQEAKAILPFIKAYESKLNHTIIHKSVRGVSDDVHQYNCNFSYNSKYYGLGIKFYSLASLNAYAGYLPITITNQQLEKGSQLPENHSVYRMFNNTVVWINKSDSWLTLDITPATFQNIPIDLCCEDLEPVTVRLAPSQSWDLYLGPNLGRVDTNFQYQTKEYPWIQGNILLKNYPECMDFDTAGSLYSQTKFPFKIPSYLPPSYEYKCMQAEASNIMIFYANRTFNVEEMGEGISTGEILMRMSDENLYFGISDESLNDTARVMENYQAILEGNPALNPQLVDINGRLAWGNEASSTGFVGTVKFPDGSEIVTRSEMPARLRFYENATLIHLEGYVPMEELAKIARSLESYR